MTSTEPGATALLLTTCGLLLMVSVLFGQASQRTGVPIALLFLTIGMVAGSEGIGGIAFEDYRLCLPPGIDGPGPDPVRRRTQYSAGGGAADLGAQRGVLATVGVILTAAMVAVPAKLWGLNWAEALLLGAVVSSTDAAAVFAVLRGTGSSSSAGSA